MFKNYIKTAWRSLKKNRFYSIVNIAGLTCGLTIGILILLWVQDELSYDRFHKNSANIYRLELFGGTGASKQIWQETVYPMGELARQQLPEVENAVRLTTDVNFSLFKYHDKAFGNESVAFADPSFFQVFDFPIVTGDRLKPFTGNNSVVITKTTARRFFGDENPIGKVIVADGKEGFAVSGVINDFPKNSSFRFDMILPMTYHVSFMRSMQHDLDNDFNSYDYDTYLQLKPGTSLKELSASLFKIHIKHRPEDTDADYLLLPISKMHLYNADLSNRGIETVHIFTVISILILVIACINYVNLATARSMLRAKEISMRKIVGAAKVQLFLQFIIETALTFAFAAALSLVCIYLVMPLFNQLSGKQLHFDIGDYRLWMVILSTIVGTLAISSIYPALLLSSFEPLKAIKGKISTGIGDVLFRKILVVTQFSFSIVLIIGTIIITRQLGYIRSKDLGYDKSHTLSFWMRDMGSHYEAVKAELLKQPGVLAVTRSSQNIVSLNGISGDNDWEGKAPGQTFIVHPMSVDKDFLSFFNMKMASGTGLTGSVSDSNKLILNEAAVKEIGLKDPIGKHFRMWRVNGTIVGVVKDFHYGSMKEKIGPSVLYYYPPFLQTMYVKTSGRDAAKAIAAAGAQFKQYNGEFPFSYAFLDDTFNELYKGEQQEGTLFNYFAGIAILISCLGLLGLAAYTAQVRTREIGVRKVLGASVNNILGLLASDFMKLVFIAILVAVPVSFYAMNKWLLTFAYRIDIPWWIFPLAGALAIGIAFLTISFQSIKAALANPVKSLRSE